MEKWILATTRVDRKWLITKEFVCDKSSKESIVLSAKIRDLISSILFQSITWLCELQMMLYSYLLYAQLNTFSASQDSFPATPVGIKWFY